MFTGRAQVLLWLLWCCNCATSAVLRSATPLRREQSLITGRLFPKHPPPVYDDDGGGGQVVYDDGGGGEREGGGSIARNGGGGRAGKGRKSLKARQGDDDGLYTDPLELEGLKDTEVVVKKTAWRRPGFFILALACALTMTYWMYQLCTMYKDYEHNTEVYVSAAMQHDWRFTQYVKYRFAYWFVWTRDSSGRTVFYIFVTFVIVGALVYCAAFEARATHSFYKIFVWLVAPDGGENEETHTGQMIGAMVSLGGLLIFALVLTLIQDRFSRWMEDLRLGFHPVMESGHIVIIGFEPQTLVLIQEFCHARAARGGSKIAILSTQTKPDVEDEIRAAEIDLCGSSVVVRSGCLSDTFSLRLVSADTASTVIVNPTCGEEVDADGKEARDAIAIRILILLREMGWPIRGKIIVVCYLIRNLELLQQLGGPQTNVVMLDKYVGKLMTQCGRACGLAGAVSQVLGFEGSEFYIRPAPLQVCGKSFTDAGLSFKGAILVGVASYPTAKLIRTSTGFQQADRCAGTHAPGQKAELILCPGPDYIISAEDDIVVLAEDAKDISVVEEDHIPDVKDVEALRIPLDNERGTQSATISAPPVQTVFFLGWNKQRIIPMLLDIDGRSCKGSKVIIFSPQDAESRETALNNTLRAENWHLSTVEVLHQVGNPASRYQLEMLEPGLECASQIYVLSDPQASSLEMADAWTVTTVLHIREILKKRGIEDLVRIVPDIVDTRSKAVCKRVGIVEYVNCAKIEAQVLATIAEDTRVGELLDRITTDGKHEIEIKGLHHYLDDGVSCPPAVSFSELWAIVLCRTGDIVLGWTNPDEKVVTINPTDKILKRPWSVDTDRLVVLCACPDSSTGKRGGLHSWSPPVAETDMTTTHTVPAGGPKRSLAQMRSQTSLV